MRTIIYSILMPLFILMIFLSLVIYNPLFNKRQERYFVISTLILIIMLIVISLDYIFAINSNLWMARKITSFLNFAACPLIPLFLYRITNPNKSSRYTYIPLIVNFLLCTLSIYTGVIYEINPSNAYNRGPLFFLPFLTMIFYMSILIHYNIHQGLRGKHFEGLFLSGVIILLIVGMYLEIILRFHFLSWVAASLSFPMYYILLNINQSMLDPLTGAYNRSMYTKDLERIRSRNVCIIALLDINNFKLINDTYGHDAGDQFLTAFSNIVQKNLPNSKFYRIGGDEFVIISKKDNLEKTRNNIDYARKETNIKGIDFSYGIDQYNPSDHIEEFLNRIDFIMYENKKQDRVFRQS